MSSNECDQSTFFLDACGQSTLILFFLHGRVGKLNMIDSHISERVEIRIPVQSTLI
jgi:fucose 4-O-acetylase-like acetyltransferase